MTGAAGHISDMIARIRMNESAIRRKRYFKEARAEYIRAAKQKNLDYHRATPEQLEAIRELVIQNRRKDQISFFIAMGLSVFLSIFVIWGLWAWFKSAVNY
ncbi:MAG: hypothetical protein EA393_13860 [Bacteroidetes bacterium]|nr:MAG: hypothetical protein EA393_13860 [Bacteroidota bacterium]